MRFVAKKMQTFMVEDRQWIDLGFDANNQDNLPDMNLSTEGAEDKRKQKTNDATKFMIDPEITVN